jgi:hypothetical protein
MVMCQSSEGKKPSGIFFRRLLPTLCYIAASESWRCASKNPLAVVDGVTIGSEEVEESLAGQSSKLEEQIYNLKRQKLDALINETLLTNESANRSYDKGSSPL